MKKSLPVTLITLPTVFLMAAACFVASPKSNPDSNANTAQNPDDSSPNDSSSDGTSTLEVCDAIDNDGNGIIDDVDKDYDGVCDCLKIATLGYPGTWGKGSVFTDWLNGKSDYGVDALSKQNLTSELLQKYQVIVVQNVRSEGSDSTFTQGIDRDYSAEEIEVLKNWVHQGGGLMTLIGYDKPAEVNNVNRLLSPFDIQYDDEEILRRDKGGSTIPITHWSDIEILTEAISGVGVDNGYPVLGGTPLAWEPVQNGWNIGAIATPEKGHVLVWGDEWVTYDSEWTDHPDYQVERFWQNALKWLSPDKVCQIPIAQIN